MDFGVIGAAAWLQIGAVDVNTEEQDDERERINTREESFSLKMNTKT